MARDTDEVLRRIKFIWRPGMSASDLAAEISLSYKKMTRNAIIGMFDRHAKALAPCSLNDALKKKSVKGGGNIPARRPRRTTATPALPQGEPLEAPQQFNIPLMELTDATCKWPTGDFPPYTFCGCETREDSAYCPYHHHVAHNHVPAPAKFTRPIFRGHGR